MALSVESNSQRSDSQRLKEEGSTQSKGLEFHVDYTLLIHYTHGHSVVFTCLAPMRVKACRGFDCHNPSMGAKAPSNPAATTFPKQNLRGVIAYMTVAA